MNQTEKQKLITEVVTLLQMRLDALSNTPAAPAETAVPKPAQPVEMLTIKECAEHFRGLSAHTVRQLVLQGKIPSVRTGAGRNGKFLISKAALLAYLNENGGAVQ